MVEQLAGLLVAKRVVQRAEPLEQRMVECWADLMDIQWVEQSADN